MKNRLIVGIIPARYGSTRFEGKPLVDIGGKTMIQRVYEQCCQFPFHRVMVATDSVNIFEHVVDFGGVAVMTSPQHRSGTERCAEVAQALINQKVIKNRDIIVNIQGDEPFIQPQQIENVANQFLLKKVSIATLVKKIECEEEINNPNVVKAVINKKQNALYFSRSRIPFVRNIDQQSTCDYWKHIGIYGYKAKTLLKLVKLSPTPLETAESLEQLRWLENGYKIHTRSTTEEGISIDTPEDLAMVIRILEKNKETL